MVFSGGIKWTSWQNVLKTFGIKHLWLQTSSTSLSNGLTSERSESLASSFDSACVPPTTLVISSASSLYPSGITCHWNILWSAPPVLIKFIPSIEKRTFVTWAEWPLYLRNFAPATNMEKHLIVLVPPNLMCFLFCFLLLLCFYFHRLQQTN